MQTLPQELIQQTNFQELFNLCTQKKNSEVVIFDKENKNFYNKQIYRKYMSFLNVPEFDQEVKKSYMFCEKAKEVPQELLKYLAFAKSIDPRYNQMVVNWYEKDDYIEAHRDCTSKFIDKEAPILMLNFNEDDQIENARDMVFNNAEDENDSYTEKLVNNSYLLINNNTTHRHRVGKGNSRRVSITFRMIQE